MCHTFYAYNIHVMYIIYIFIHIVNIYVIENILIYIYIYTQIYIIICHLDIIYYWFHLDVVERARPGIAQEKPSNRLPRRWLDGRPAGTPWGMYYSICV